MRSTVARRACVIGVVLGLAALTACAKEEPAAKDDGTGPVSVKASDSGCDLSRRDVKSGTSTFSVENAGRARCGTQAAGRSRGLAVTPVDSRATWHTSPARACPQDCQR